MADLKVFSLQGGVSELISTQVAMEKELQTLIEQNMQAFFGVTFLKSEFTIAGGRIDSLGIDENNCPVIFEYKRSLNENVINQGLFYLNWLMDHRADFKWLVMETLGHQKAESIDWSLPTVFCIANNFTRYDEHAVNQMQRNIRLVKYKKYGSDLIVFEHLNAPSPPPAGGSSSSQLSSADKATGGAKDYNTFAYNHENASEWLKNMYDDLRTYILSLGDDVTLNELKLYVAFKKVKNIVCVQITKHSLLLHLQLSPATVALRPGFLEDYTNIGHWGTGNLRMIIKSKQDFEEAKALLDRAYNEN